MVTPHPLLVTNIQNFQQQKTFTFFLSFSTVMHAKNQCCGSGVIKFFSFKLISSIFLGNQKKKSYNKKWEKADPYQNTTDPEHCLWKNVLFELDR